MSKGLLFRLSIAFLLLSFWLYSYVDRQNYLTALRLKIPKVVEDIRFLQEENKRYLYEIDHFESPAHLIELAHLEEFSHLKHPLIKDVLKVPQGVALNEKSQTHSESKKYFGPSFSVVAEAH